MTVTAWICGISVSEEEQRLREFFLLGWGGGGRGLHPRKLCFWARLVGFHCDASTPSCALEDAFVSSAVFRWPVYPRHLPGESLDWLFPLVKISCAM